MMDGPVFDGGFAQYSDEVKAKAKAIQLVVFDVDGVLTDGRLTYTDSGQELKSFNVKDGQGIALLTLKGIKTAIITARQSPINEQRAKELGISYLYQNAKHKWTALTELAETLALPIETIAYVGDDLPDYQCLSGVGLPCCPADAVAEVKSVCTLVSAYPGGGGAVREVCDLILRAQGIYPELQTAKEEIVSNS